MNYNDSYYDLPYDESARAWEQFCDEWEGDNDPTGDDFDNWLQEQADRAEDAAIERAEAAREDYDLDPGAWGE